MAKPINLLKLLTTKLPLTSKAIIYDENGLLPHGNVRIASVEIVSIIRIRRTCDLTLLQLGDPYYNGTAAVVIQFAQMVDIYAPFHTTLLTDGENASLMRRVYIGHYTWRTYGGNVCLSRPQVHKILGEAFRAS